MRKRYEEEKEKHEHNFEPVEGRNEWHCISLVGKAGNPCGTVCLTAQEYGRRKEAWNQYYQAVEKTESYSLFNLMRSAYKDGNKEMVADARARLQQLIVEDTHELVKPNLPDPYIESHYDRLFVGSVDNYGRFSFNREY